MNNNVGERIKAARLKLGLTQEELGARVGVKRAAINKYETGRVENIKRSMQIKLADALHVSPVSLFYDDLSTKASNVSIPNVKAIPILGNICAGNGVFCEENYSGTFYADDSIKADVCVRVHGDSMIDAGIYDGDMAFIRETADYENGKIYAVLINSDIEAVLKKVTWNNDRVVLNPCNSSADYTPLIQPINEVYIVGECVGIYHPTV